MKLNDSRSLAGYTSSIYTLTTNSSLNIQLTRNARETYSPNKKESHRAAFTVEKDDIVNLVLKTWDEHFAHIATNQKAVVAERGWGLFKNNLLLHPEIQLTSSSNLETHSPVFTKLEPRHH